MRTLAFLLFDHVAGLDTLFYRLASGNVTASKRYCHLNFIQHVCELELRVPRAKLPDGSVRQVEPPWAAELPGFTLLFEAFVLALCREMSFSGVTRLTSLSVYRVMRICERHVVRRSVLPIGAKCGSLRSTRPRAPKGMTT